MGALPKEARRFTYADYKERELEEEKAGTDDGLLAPAARDPISRY